MPKQLVKFATILVFILLSTSLNAQVDTSKADHGVNINFFNGYAISYKWDANQSMNYRVYLSLNSSLTGDEYDRENHNSDDYKSNSENTSDSKFFATNLSFQFLFNIISQKSLNLYLGIGPNLNYSYQKWDNTSMRQNDDDSKYTSESTNTNTAYGVGVISLVGIEAYLTDTITLFAETHLSGMKFWSNGDSKNSSEQNNSIYSYESSSTGSGWSANLQLVKVGLGIYF